MATFSSSVIRIIVNHQQRVSTLLQMGLELEMVESESKTLASSSTSRGPSSHRLYA